MTRPGDTRDSTPPFSAALRFGPLTPVYDTLVRLMGHEDRWRGALVRRVGLRPGERLLELGCGTGSLTVRLAAAAPDASIVAVDPDPRALVRARRRSAGLPGRIQFHEAYADRLPDADPFRSGSFDRIVSSLVFHHLDRAAKVATLAGARRLLRPGGALYIADWAEARDWGQRVRFLGIQLIDGFGTTSDNVHGLLPYLIREAGFADVVELAYARTRFGPFAFWRARGAD
ncbi:MAG: class I SAM-dependent methyltransferase [Pseudomonadales bacterium]|nr:class I SAM-dependent methyltransferase [Pseudomonadales bacterium]